MSEKKAVFFCSASNDIDPKYNQAARDTVRAACLAGYSIVSGGSFRGTMGAVCDAAKECGAPNYGVLFLSRQLCLSLNNLKLNPIEKTIFFLVIGTFNVHSTKI